jgi:hypothetical protein
VDALAGWPAGAWLLSVAVMTDPGTTETRRGMLRPLLWAVLVVSAAANATSSTVGAHPIVGVGFGLITLACAAVLVVHHYRHRAR